MARNFRDRSAPCSRDAANERHILLCDVAPHHLAANAICVLAHGMAAVVVAKQTDHLASDGLGVPNGTSTPRSSANNSAACQYGVDTTALPEPNA